MAIYNENFSKLYNINNQNDFSEALFNNFKEYIVEKNLVFNSHLDLACGTGIFCINMAKLGIGKVRGIDISEGMINQAKSNAAKENIDIEFCVDDMTKASSFDKFDLITCNYDSINHLENFDAWKKTFNNVYNMLNDNGYFLFDFNTFVNFNKLISMPEEVEKTDDYTCKRIVNKIDDNYLEFVFNYEFNDSTSEEQKVKEGFYDTQLITNALENSGFKIIDILGKKFVKSEDLNSEQKLHILCQKVRI